jgi:hypothetical protein
MEAEITNETDPLRVVAGTAEGDGKSLRLFLAAEIVRIGLERELDFADVAQANGMTQSEFKGLMEGVKEGAELWKLFAILKSLGAAVVIAVDPIPRPAGGVITWSRISAATGRAVQSIDPYSTRRPR